MLCVDRSNDRQQALPSACAARAEAVKAESRRCPVTPIRSTGRLPARHHVLSDRLRHRLAPNNECIRFDFRERVVDYALQALTSARRLKTVPVRSAALWSCATASAGAAVFFSMPARSYRADQSVPGGDT